MQDIPSVTTASSKPPVRQLIAVALIGIVLVVLAGVAYWFTTMRSATVFPKTASVAVSLGFVPASELFTLNQETTRFEQVRVAGTPEGMVVIDRVFTDSGTVYLLLNPATAVANLYRQDGETLIPVTTSATMKFDVSYDAANGTYVYLSKSLATPTDFLTTTSWDVVALDTNGTERTLATALHAEVVPGKNAVLAATTEGVVSWISLATGAVTPLLTQEQGWVFAVNAEGTRLAVYNHAVKTVSVFTLENAPVALTASSMVESPDRLASLAFMGDTLVGAHPDAAQAATIFTVLGGKATLSVSHPNPSVPSAAYNLSIDL